MLQGDPVPILIRHQQGPFRPSTFPLPGLLTSHICELLYAFRPFTYNKRKEKEVERGREQGDQNLATQRVGSQHLSQDLQKVFLCYRTTTTEHF